MERLEQENKELREGMTAMQTEVEKLTALVSTLMAAQNQASQSTDAVLESVTSAIPSSTVVSHAIIPKGFSWGMPHGFNEDPRHFSSTSTTKPVPSGGYPWGMPHRFNEGFHPTVSEVPIPIFQQSTSVPQPGAIIPEPVVTYSAPLVHTDRQD